MTHLNPIQIEHPPEHTPEICRLHIGDYYLSLQLGGPRIIEIAYGDMRLEIKEISRVCLCEIDWRNMKTRDDTSALQWFLSRSIPPVSSTEQKRELDRFFMLSSVWLNRVLDRDFARLKGLAG